MRPHLSKIFFYLIVLITLVQCKKDGEVEKELIPLAPTKLTGNTTPLGIQLSWTDNSTNENGFRVERKSTGESYKEVGVILKDVTVFNDSLVTANTSYTYRVYAFNAAGKSLTYTNEITVNAPAKPFLKITQMTDSLTNLGTVFEVDVISDGGTPILEYGICYGTIALPTIANSKSVMQGKSIGKFPLALADLVPNTMYYARGYIKNAQGVVYSNEISFKTLAGFTLGQYYQFGQIGYILQTGDPGFDPNVQHGLIISASAFNPVEWGCSGQTISGADGAVIGAGKQNTADILNACKTANIAAKKSTEWITDGQGQFSKDWYLPSREEMVRLFANRSLFYLATNTPYWTSTEVNALQAYQVTSSGVVQGNKNTVATFRPVKAF